MSGFRKLLQTQPAVEGAAWTLTNAIEQYGVLNRRFNTFNYGGYNGIFFKPDGTKLYILKAEAPNRLHEFDLSTPWDQETATFVQSLNLDDFDNSLQGIFFTPDGLNMFMVGAETDIIYNFFLSTPWDISTATRTPKKSVSVEEISPEGLFFKPDGTKMYVIGNTGDNVNEYDLSIPWLVSSATYLQNFSIAAQEISSSGLSFKPDGTKMYVIGFTGDDVNEYDLSIPWDVSSATYLQNFSFVAQENTASDLFFKPDGTKMYVLGRQGLDVIEYDLSTAWDVSSATYLRNFYIGSQENGPEGLFFKPDGLKMYVVGLTGDDVNEYNLSTAWDVSSATYLQNFSIAAQEISPKALSFKPDGTKMYVIGIDGDDVNEYSLGVAWDVSTASATPFFSVAAQETNPQGLFFKPDGTKMYVIGTDGDNVIEYDLSIPWNLLSAGFLQVFSVAAQETFPTDISFKADGTKMYVIGQTGDDVNEYDLSTAWDISTASYLQNFSVALQEIAPHSMTFKPDGTILYINGNYNNLHSYVLPDPWNITSIIVPDYFDISAQEISPEGLFFKPDGTKMYVIGSVGDDVNEYDLSIPWDVNSAVFLQLFSVAAQESAPRGVFFKPDGTKMYVIGSTGDDVNEYDLSIPWDVSTATYVQNFSIGAQETFPLDVSFKPDGTKMYVIGSTGDDVNEYDLSTPWDVSTASYLQNFSVAAQETTPSGIFFKPDGLKMFITGQTGDSVYEYDLSIPWDVSSATYLQVFSWLKYWGSHPNPGTFSIGPNTVFFKPEGDKIYILGAELKVFMVDL